jgi:hypothetical protein
MAADPEEARVDEADLIAELPRVLEAIGRGVVFFVMRGEVCAFVLGPDEVCGRVMGLVDAEYGWPHMVRLHEVRTAEDLWPGLRQHPVLVDGERVVAVAIGDDEYAMIRARSR